ncbi:MAG: DUF1080 domain-containing protein [Verrucomicrobiota bacterium]
MAKSRYRIWIPALFVVGVAVALGKDVAVPTWTDPKKALSADPDFSKQGEYVDDATGKAFQVAALGDGTFHVLNYSGGLPGDGWNGEGPDATKIESSELSALLGEAKRVERKSPTLGLAAPEGALVVFAGEKTEHLEADIEKGVFWAGAKTLTPVGDFKAHIEFRLPYKPQRDLSSQDRGNSGIYIFGNYECQVLDSFGLSFDVEANAVAMKSANTQWCGSFYKVKTPDVPMSFPPLQWQTYDIDFTAPRFDESGEKIENARVTIRHNGVVIHDDFELEKGTGAGAKKPEKPKGTILFQGHGNPVAFQNVWILEK